MSDEQKWGFGNPADPKPFARTILGTADRGRPIDLIFGEHPHSRRDDNIYARGEHGDINPFDGHRVLIDVSLRSSNYLKESHYSGDEIRKGGSCEISADGVVVFEFFFRDPQWALLKAHRLITELGEHPSNWLVAAERAGLIGRKVFYERHPAKIVRLIEDQGCLILEPDGGNFPAPVWKEDQDDWLSENASSVKTEVTDPKIWWFRK